MQIIKLISIVVAAVLLFGCASGAKRENMAVQSQGQQRHSYDSALNQQINVASVTGGQKTNPAWTSEIGNEEFLAALRNSLMAEQLYSTEGRYELRVQLLQVDQPLLGLDMTVTTHIAYTLQDRNTGENLLQETIVASYTATMGDAFMGVTRLRLANEGSGKANIEALLAKLASMKVTVATISLAE